jgi:hypothetical protein
MTQQVKSITSEALEAAYRALTPSQDGFTEDLMASNTIIPVLDLTAQAQGAVPEQLWTALAFSSQSAFRQANNSAVIANSPGFYRIIGVGLIDPTATGNVKFTMSDGLSTKTIWELACATNANTSSASNIFDFVVFLRSGDSVSASSSSGSNYLAGSIRQIADVSGNLVYPVGFTPQ